MWENRPTCTCTRTRVSSSRLRDPAPQPLHLTSAVCFEGAPLVATPSHPDGPTILIGSVKFSFNVDDPEITKHKQPDSH